MIEPLLLTVVDCSLGKQRGPTLSNAVQQIFFSDVGEGLLLARKRGVGQVLGRRRRPNRDERLAVADLT